MYSINDLFSIPGVNSLPSVVYFQNIDKNNVDLSEIKTRLVSLQQELKNNYGTQPIEYNDSVIKFFGQIPVDVSDITGREKSSFNLNVENEVNFADQVQTSLSDSAISFFGATATEIKNQDKNKVNSNNNTQQPQEQRESKMSNREANNDGRTSSRLSQNSRMINKLQKTVDSHKVEGNSQQSAKVT